MSEPPSRVRHVFRWDLDKTYLRTEFESLGDLVRSALEKAKDKRAVPGAPAVLRALRAAGGREHRICIVSGSPRQMRRVLVEKLRLDGVAFDELVLKPNLENLVTGRFRALRQQLPYKLPALLASRVALADDPPETLFGDDAESDGLIYSLYADLLLGRVTTAALAAVLDEVGAYAKQRATTLSLAEKIHPGDAVKRIFIRLDQHSPTAPFDQFGPRLVPIYNYFQAALVLFGDGQLSGADVIGVAREMLASGDYELGTLANSLQDLLRRGRLTLDVAMRLALASQDVLIDHRADWRDLPPADEIAWAFATRVTSLPEGTLPPPPPEPGPIDYAALVKAEGQERAKKRRRGKRNGVSP